MIGLSKLLAYPNQRNTLDSVSTVGEELSRNGRNGAMMKKGNQHMVNALIIMPRVVLAFLSLASWNLSFFWLLVVLGEVCKRLDFCCLCFLVCLIGGLFVSMGHWDSLLCLDWKHLARPVFSKLH